MATDYSILEAELTSLKSQLKRELHMKEVHKLSRKQYGLAKNVVQRMQIENLTWQVAEMESTVSRLYSVNHKLEDGEIKNYLLYLLKLKDYFSGEVSTKEEIIKQRESQIKMMLKKLCKIVDEKAKKKKHASKKFCDFTRIDNLTSRMDQINTRINSMRQENNEIKEDIMNMRLFQRHFKTLEKEFRRKIKFFESQAHEHLERAVTAYEEKEEFANKEKVYNERCAMEQRKAAINENALNLWNEKSEKNESFSNLQYAPRTDARIAEAGDLIERKVTGLEPLLNEMVELNESIAEASGERDPNDIGYYFILMDEKLNSKFTHLDEILKDMNYWQEKIDHYRHKNQKLMRNLTIGQRRLLKDIQKNTEAVEVEKNEAELADKALSEATEEINGVINGVQFLYRSFLPEKADDSNKIDDLNLVDYVEEIEHQTLEYLICLEYIRMMEAAAEGPVLTLKPEDDAVVIDKPPKLEFLDTIQPRALTSECEMQGIEDIGEEKTFLELEDLQERAKVAVTEIQTEEKSLEDRLSESFEKK